MPHLVNARLFLIFPALPGYSTAASRLTLLLAMCASIATPILLTPDKRTTASVYAIMRKTFKVVVQLVRIKVKNSNAAATVFLTIGLLELTALSSVHSSAAISGQEQFFAATG